ncbi:MAG: serine/threonine protein kinase [Loktanella sp.]|nr:serine/threonine protein kinase [Loktanella sp.]
MANPNALETSADDKDSFVDELKPGTKLLHGQYTIDSFLNAGGFGITYLARDSLDRKIVIKECFPGAFCRRSRFVVQARSRAHQNELKSIVRLFVQEARSLSKLDHPNIVGVHQVFEDNDTAYMALDFVEGLDLLDMIEDPKTSLTPAQIKSILRDLLGAVGFIHDQGMLHRDISPDNILIDKAMRPVLIDFGAAREQATKQTRVLSALRVVKDGYSPQEFYIAGSDQGPSSDLYALAASFYHLISTDVPTNSQARLAAIAAGDPDPYNKLAGRISGYDDAFLAAMDKALSVLPKDRLQSAKAWLDMMDGVQGNVTPLNRGAVAAPANTATESKTPSRMPLLLGAAAVVALLVGVGYVVTGNDPAPEIAASVAPAPAPAPAPFVAATPAPAPTPEPSAPAETANVVAEPPSAATLPNGPLARTTPAAETAAPALPDTPDVIAQVGTGPALDITPIVPSNEIIASGLVPVWSVQLPFNAAEPGSDTIGQVSSDTAEWVQPGVVVTSVNGTDISAIAEITPALRASTDTTPDTTEVTATFTVLTPDTGASQEHDLTLPVVYGFSLPNGLAFESGFADDSWRTFVTAAPEDTSGGLQVGDIVTSFIQTSELINERTSLLDIFNRESENGTERYTFAVQRDGTMWVASLTYIPEVD